MVKGTGADLFSKLVIGRFQLKQRVSIVMI
jgi:hypothetical protein